MQKPMKLGITLTPRPKHIHRVKIRKFSVWATYSACGFFRNGSMGRMGVFQLLAQMLKPVKFLLLTSTQPHVGVCSHVNATRETVKYVW